MKNIVILGSTGALGGAFVTQYSQRFPKANIHAVSRAANRVTSDDNVMTHQIDFTNEADISALATHIGRQGHLDLMIIAIGTLHDQGMQPEKSLSQLSFEQLEKVFNANLFIPSMLIKHFAPLLNNAEKSVCALLSARVGSISDNRLGGWYAYRMSKSALNMLIKTTSIEIARRNRQALVIGLHPGTVDSNLSKPFQKNVPKGKLFTPQYSATCLIDVIDNLTAENSGKCFAWDGSEIMP